MSGLSAFLSQNAIQTENEEHIISKRFIDKSGSPIPWEIRAIDEDFNETIRKSCIKRERDKKTRSIIETTDTEMYLAKLMVECVVFPNLKDVELQESYGVLGAEALVKKMLTAGEYSELLECVQKVNGFDVDDDLVDEAKN
ncbi:MAG: phage portal protein [Epulopiscium sp.]|nr:phage portal protein [Candidatus Epulonipiscium sp.]